MRSFQSSAQNITCDVINVKRYGFLLQFSPSRLNANSEISYFHGLKSVRVAQQTILFALHCSPVRLAPRVLNRHERALVAHRKVRLPLVDVVRRFYWLALLGIIVPHIRRVRGCLTLMLAVAANATTTPSPARLTGL